MPFTYTPVPGNAPATETLPSDLDDADAESVNSAFRALADNLFGLAALIGQANTFTQPQSVDVADDPTAPLLTTTKTAFDYAANPTNGWKVELKFPLDGTGRNAYFYTGANDSSGMFALTINAYWQPGASGSGVNKWHQEVSGKASFGLFIVGEQLVISRQNSGTSPWSAWPTDQGDISLGGSVFAAGAGIGAGGIGSLGNVHTAADFAYVPVKIRTDSITPSVDMLGSQLDDTGVSLLAGTTELRFLSFRPPPNASLGKLQFVHVQATTLPSTFYFMEYTPDFTLPHGGATIVSINEFVVSDAASGFLLTEIDLTGVTIDSNKEYRIAWAPGHTNDGIHAIRMVSWQDAGPRNNL